jgi:DNA-binding PadR family transcriptional regulator
MLVDRLILEELRRAPAHGYELKARIGRRGVHVSPSTVYSALRRLERDRILSARWQDGRRRHVYRLTRLGEEALFVQRLEIRSIGHR